MLLALLECLLTELLLNPLLLCRSFTLRLALKAYLNAALIGGGFGGYFTAADIGGVCVAEIGGLT